MTKQGTLAKLRRIRALREQRAMEAAAREQRLASEAQRVSRSAADALDAHLEQVAADERAASGDLLRERVTIEGLLRLRGRFEVAAHEGQQLRAAEDEARRVEAEQRDKLAGARSDHQARRKSVEKLDRVAHDLRLRSARRLEEVEEVAMEEEAALVAASRGQ